MQDDNELDPELHDGITLKRGVYGYTWTVYAKAIVPGVQGLLDAVERVKAIDADLTRIYGKPEKRAK